MCVYVCCVVCVLYVCVYVLCCVQSTIFLFCGVLTSDLLKQGGTAGGVGKEKEQSEAFFSADF